MTIYTEKQEKYGFIYIWFDRKHKRYYVGSHWGFENDGYICSSNWMYNTYKRRKEDFKRRILKRVYTNRIDLLNEEQRWLNMIQDHELATNRTTTELRKTVRYYNFCKSVQKSWHYEESTRKTISEKISIAKTGKSAGPCSQEKAAKISEAKKKKFAERGGISDAHRLALSKIKKKPHTAEWKEENSKRMKDQWSDPNSERRKNISEASKKRWEQYRLNKSLGNSNL